LLQNVCIDLDIHVPIMHVYIDVMCMYIYFYYIYIYRYIYIHELSCWFCLACFYGSCIWLRRKFSLNRFVFDAVYLNTLILKVYF